MALTERGVRGNGSRVSKPVEDKVAKPEWGLKRTCRECGKRFYDFHRNPIVCPGCQAVFDPLATLRPRRSRSASAPAARPAEPAAAEEPPETADREETEDDIVGVEDAEIDDEDGVIDSEDDDGMIKDTADLGDDRIAAVIADDGK